MKSMAMKMDLPEISPRVSFTGFHNVVDGRLRDAQTTYHGINPATSEKLWPVPVATESDLEDAVKAARHAFNSWAKVTIEGRKRLVEQWIEKLKSHEADFTDLLIHESGKPRMIAKLEVKGSCETAIHSSTYTP
jgi:acyl-CoA reductase-like NAD-dependent aldehyde dehydrogenase